MNNLYSFCQNENIPTWTAPILVGLFACLWGVWLLPHTVFIRHSAMVFGCILGLYVCVKNYHLFFNKEALPIFGCIALLIWVTFHLFFIGSNYEIQKIEYMGVWKKVILCTPFSIGMGIAVAKSKKYDLNWNIFYVGLTLPVIIYFIKFIITQNAQSWEVENQYFLLNSDHQNHNFGVSRALYPFFCMPSFITALFILIDRRNSYSKFIFVYFVSVCLTPLLFFLEGERTGLLMVVNYFLISLIKLAYKLSKKPSLRSVCISILLIIFLTISFMGFSKKFTHLKLVFENINIALNYKNTEHWKHQGLVGLPLNSSNTKVDGSIYFRISWALAGIELILENPLGYGLLTLSFDYLSKNKWPESQLGLTHSGWIDFSLGYGIVGLVLFLFSCLAAWKSGFNFSKEWKIFILWSFFILIIIFLLKEISYEVIVNAFIFLIMFIGAYSSTLYSQKNTTVSE
jgi:hypothetical protein